MARRHYSDEARAAALAVLDANGGKLARSAREAGVPRATLQLWAKDRDRAATPELRHQTRETLADVYGRVADRATALVEGALGKITSDALAADARLLTAVNTVGAVATDKRQLLTDKPTENVKQRVEVTVHRKDRPIRASD